MSIETGLIMERRLRTLFVTIYTPLRTDTGGHQRTSIIYNFLKENTDLDTLFLNVSHDKVENTDNFFSYVININPSLSERIKSNLKLFSQYFITPKHKKCAKIYKEYTQRTKYDLIYFRFMATAIKCGVEDFSNVIIDVDDAPWQVHKSLSNSPSLSWYKRLYCKLRLPLIEYNSKKLLHSCKYYLTANPDDVFSKNGMNLPNIPMNICLKEDNNVYNKNIMFVGLMKYYPNYEGMDHFIKNIWSEVIKLHPDANLFIVGKGTPDFLYKEWKNVKNVNVLGYVEELQDIYNKCSVVISPIYNGAGTNIKVLEALAMNKICVVSRFALKGFDKILSNREDLFVANNDNEFIEMLDILLSNPERYNYIAKNGHEKVLKFFSKTYVTRILNKTIS